MSRGIKEYDRRRKLSDKEEIELILLYNKGIELKNIARAYNISTANIRLIRIKYKIKNRKREYKTYFKKINQHGCNNDNWRGGIYIKGGYKLIINHEHPYKDKCGYIREHRLIMEKYLGRYLEREEVVHHKDENKLNNNIENLQLFKNQGEHRKAHKKNGT